ncbi:MAG TPA: hypothetical protein VHW66_13600 [Stellaceae bacterium]|nr:hypothetical protein [Stellaceae bacterium]
MKSIFAIRVLARRHVRLMTAKTAIERLLVREEATVDVPMVEDTEVFERELTELKVRAMQIAPELATGDLASDRSGRQ